MAPVTPAPSDEGCSRSMCQMTPRVSKAIVGVLLAGLLPLAGCSRGNGSAQISILRPKDGTTVNLFTTIECKATGNLGDLHPVIVVRTPPHATSGTPSQLWAWIPNLQTGDRYVETGTQIGIARDAGQTFMITAVLTREPVPEGRISEMPQGPRAEVTVTRR